MVISTLVAKGTLEGELVLSRGGEQPSQAVLGSLVNLLRAGNQLYDNDAAHFSLLAVYPVLDIWPQLGLKASRGRDLGFHNANDGSAKLEKLLDQELAKNNSLAAVYIQRPYTVSVVIGQNRVVIFDSHCHQRGDTCFGSLLAISGASAIKKDIIDYVLSFFERHFSLAVADSHLCVLEKRPCV